MCEWRLGICLLCKIDYDVNLLLQMKSDFNY